MARWVVLEPHEIELLDRQDPASARDGGFQGFLVGLQKRVRRASRELKLEDDDIERIAAYAFDYKNGGWQTRLLGIFGRELGPNLGRERDSD
ncbi:MAG: hypothetical protein U0P30_15430 [Vicinamibacterales bacterium]